MSASVKIIDGGGTKSEAKQKNIRKTDDNFRRLKEITQELCDIVEKHDDIKLLVLDKKDWKLLVGGPYILGGFSSSGIGGDKSQASRGSDDYWIVKINSSGVKHYQTRHRRKSS